MDGHGGDGATSSSEASHAKTSARPVKAQASKKAREAAYSSSYTDLHVRYDPDTSSWRTSQQSLAGDSIPFSDAFMKQGMMLSGRLLRPRRSEPRIGGNDGFVWLGTPTKSMSIRSGEFGKGRLPSPAEYVTRWPTPTIADVSGGDRRKYMKQFSEGGKWFHPGLRETVMDLEDKKQQWPTPQAFEASIKAGLMGKEESGKNRHALKLVNAVAKYPTPRAREGNSGPIGSKSQIHQMKRGYLDATIYEQELGEPTQQNQSLRLNPLWVEWLMGFPRGWTDLNASVTQWFPNREGRPGVFSPIKEAN